MMPRWTDSLTEPLATIAGDGEWSRIQESARGGWLLLSHAGRGDVSWYRLPEDSLTLAPLEPFEDRRLPLREAISHWLRLGSPFRLLAWRVGRRAVFRVWDEDGSRICKIYRKHRNLLERWSVLEPFPHPQWQTPRILEWDPALRCLSIEDCAGASLNSRWLAGRGKAADGDRVADLLEWIQDATVPDAFPRYGSDDEIKLLEGRLEAFERTLRSPSPKVRELTARVIDALRAEQSRAWLLCHRDLHDKQILLDGQRGSLIDLDLAAAGPPGLDVGNILAHLRLRALKGADLPWQEIARRIAARAVRARRIEDSLGVWTASALMRLTLIYSRRRRAPDLLDRLRTSTAQALGHSGEWDGIL